VGDFWINLHNRFSIIENSYQDPTVVGSADYSRLENALGIATVWDLNQAVVKFGYDHVSYVSLQGTAQTGVINPDGESEVFSTSAGYRVRPGMLAGLELGGALIHYSKVSGSQLFTDATQWNTGAFTEAQVSQYIRARASAGYTVYSPEGGNGPGNSTDFSGLYAQVDVAHRLNQFVDYTMTGGRNINFTFYGGSVDMYYARLQANWNVLQKVSLSTFFEYDHGSLLVFGAETFDRYGPGFSVGRAITYKLSGSLAYQFYCRNSDLPARDYTANILTLNLAYKF
jgi:hypothetical protein